MQKTTPDQALNYFSKSALIRIDSGSILDRFWLVSGKISLIIDRFGTQLCYVSPAGFMVDLMDSWWIPAGFIVDLVDSRWIRDGFIVDLVDS